MSGFDASSKRTNASRQEDNAQYGRCTFLQTSYTDCLVVIWVRVCLITHAHASCQSQCRRRSTQSKLHSNANFNRCKWTTENLLATLCIIQYFWFVTNICIHSNFDEFECVLSLLLLFISYRTTASSCFTDIVSIRLYRNIHLCSSSFIDFVFDAICCTFDATEDWRLRRYDAMRTVTRECFVVLLCQ